MNEMAFFLLRWSDDGESRDESNPSIFSKFARGGSLLLLEKAAPQYILRQKYLVYPISLRSISNMYY